MNDIFALAGGQTLQNGKYTIVRMLSHGGFGVTYLARHEMLDIDVCIKEFFPSAWCNRDAFSYEVSVATAGNTGMVDRFMDKFIKEARSIWRLRHDGIVKIHDVFRENGTAYYVMDYIDGCSLQDMVKRRGPLPLDEALGYMRQAAEALGYLHDKRMNHLDIKPANMMVDTGGRLTLIDFGVAKHYGEDGHQTTTTPLCISRGYSPIEQYKDGGVSQFSPAADIYPLGATLFHLLTGTTPPEATELAVGELDIPATVPGHVAAAIRHAMRPKAEDRTPSARAFLAELSLPATPAKSPAPSPRKPDSTETVSASAPTQPKSATPVLADKSPASSPKPSAPRKRRTLIIGVLAAIFLVVIIFLVINVGRDSKIEAAVDTVSMLSAQDGNESVEDFPAPAPVAEVQAPEPIPEATTSEPEEKVYGHQKGKTGDLFARNKKNGEYRCFTPDEWRDVPDKSAYSKLGVVVNDGSCPPFYVALHDKRGGDMTWDEAVSRYGENILPSGTQCGALANNCEKIKQSMKAFGGEMEYRYWGKEYDSFYAWYVTMVGGFVYYTDKPYSYRVRPVAPVAESAM